MRLLYQCQYEYGSISRYWYLYQIYSNLCIGIGKTSGYGKNHLVFLRTYGILLADMRKVEILPQTDFWGFEISSK